MTAPFSSIYRGPPQRRKTEHNVTVEYDDFTTNVEYWLNALASPFDKPIAWDLSYVQKVVDYFLSCTTMQGWVKDITGALAKLRFALYARRQLLDMHQESWAQGKRPSQMGVQFYFSSFIIMCRACLDALAVWLTYLFELEIDTPVNRDFSRPRFRNQIKDKSAKIHRKCCELHGWFKELTAYRDRVVHRDNLPSGLYVSAGARYGPGVYYQVIKNPDAKLTDVLRGVCDTVPLDQFCETYLSNVDVLLRACFHEAWERIRYYRDVKKVGLGVVFPDE